ncbi:Cupredoxin [Flagelloscypha sp. PMI_526]|nr:Cupredoxin [Flagelloscypha sp. PMI_526]
MLLSLLGVALASSFVSAAEYSVNVGQNGFVFDPPSTTAAAGDTIVFHFFPKAHSVTRSSFEAPCTPLADGFDSGLTPTNDTTGQEKSFSLLVNDTQPIYIFCKQPNMNHCGSGMVHLVNPGQHSFEDFQAAAKASGGVASAPPAGSATSSSSSADAYSTPPSPSWVLATAPVTHGSDVYQTTYTSYYGTPQPTYAAQPADHRIVVGVDGKLAYGDSNITASIGDTVTFEFHPKNHTVTQSSFSAPCVPLEVSTGTPGFKSGFKPVADGETNFPTFQITINDTAPIWFYCGQTQPVSHCGSGMVGSINAVESGPNNFAAFQALAKRINGTTSGAAGNGTGGGSGGGSSSSPNQAGASTTMSQVGLLLGLALSLIASLL